MVILSNSDSFYLKHIPAKKIKLLQFNIKKYQFSYLSLIIQVENFNIICPSQIPFFSTIFSRFCTFLLSCRLTTVRTCTEILSCIYGPQTKNRITQVSLPKLRKKHPPNKKLIRI